MKKLSECSILIVDDTEINVDILVEALGDDYELAVAMDGESALEIIEMELPDLILLDIMMPGMSGYEVCEVLKKNPVTANIPIIFLTAMTDIVSKTKGFEAGAVDYITKPFEIMEVKARVQTHLFIKIAKNQLALQNELLEQRVLERTKQLCLTQEITIEALASLAEYRDPETGGHINRTKNYVKILSKKLSTYEKFKDILNEEMIQVFYNSAPLHDIGKIGIRDDILLKPGKLTKEEFEEMKKHTTIGYETLHIAALKLGENSFLRQAMDFARYHQEKWDGTGYPDGLAGDEIPIAGRVMAIADVYDALISKRIYKPSFTHKKAVEIINEGRGLHFDPIMVDAFGEVNEEFRQIAIKYADCAEELLTLNEV
ncbi:response regulator [Acetobacterium woodii]|uniref:Stage 0 sporulation protein A homolog n=1 Tax=Acetobacterium woodii (strain ATCC 29683 / DSM 1030 / JCM 2381 / KCTC 1655 / WB1) TaxID=931626 RepID=H6LI06_ACEWD|nr:two-component system response regulator [Acetobacterium woodii]AFA48536.1 two-component response regulator [Acetobacterium woodii DSM 1030]